MEVNKKLKAKLAAYEERELECSECHRSLQTFITLHQRNMDQLVNIASRELSIGVNDAYAEYLRKQKEFASNRNLEGYMREWQEFMHFVVVRASSRVSSSATVVRHNRT